MLVVCQDFNFGVVLPRAGKLLCAVCSHSCTTHTALVKAGVDNGCEWAVDVQQTLEATVEVDHVQSSIITDGAIGRQRLLPPPDVCSTCGQAMGPRSEEKPSELQ